MELYAFLLRFSLITGVFIEKRQSAKGNFSKDNWIIVKGAVVTI